MVILAKIISDVYTKKSDNLKFQSSDDKKKLKLSSTESSSNFPIIFIILYFLCGGACAYFSWKHNSKIGWTTGYKALFSAFAFFCPFEYVSIYLTYKSDMLKYMERTKTEFVEKLPSK